MKTLLALCIILFAGCESRDVTTHYTTVMIDCTEEDGYRPKAREIKPHSVLHKRENGMYFSIIPINNLAYNTHNGVTISQADIGLNYDELSRKMVVDDYNLKIDSLLNQIDSMRFGTNQSQIFRSVVSEARFLMKQECQERKIVCYSDLEENSSFFSLKNQSHQKLMSQPKSLQDLFEKEYSIGENESFEGLKIEIHHLPNHQKEEDFDVFLKLYQDIFESRGARVTHELSNLIHVQ